MTSRRINPLRWLFLLALFVGGWYLIGQDARRSTNSPHLDAPATGIPPDDSNQQQSFFVTYVFDGDSLKAEDEAGQIHRLRLSGIDAPERDQPFAEQARSHLIQLCGNQAVEATLVDRDRYGRMVVELRCRETWVNGEMVRAGLAWYNRRYRKSAKLEQFQRVAQTQKRGLWSEDRAVPPWEFRRSSQ